MSSTHSDTLHGGPSVGSSTMLWLVRPFGLLSGSLVDAACSPQGRLLALATGVLQILASTLTGLGCAAFLALQHWEQGDHPPWSWAVAGVCVACVLIFDAALNVALNHTLGWRHGMLKTLRIGITVVLSLQASHMAMLMFQASSLAEPAGVVAQARVDASLSTLRSQLQVAAAASASANQALADHVVKAPSPAAEPEACAQARQLVAEDAPLQARQQREAQALCRSQVALGASAYQARHAAHETAQQILAASAITAQSEVKKASDALAAEEALRPTRVARLSATPAVRQAAFEHLQEEDPSLRWGTVGLACVGLVLELLAVLAKSMLRNRDEAVLRDRLTLSENVTPLRAQLLAHELLCRAQAQLPSNVSLRQTAFDQALTQQSGLVAEAAIGPATQAAYNAWLKSELQRSAAAAGTGPRVG